MNRQAFVEEVVPVGVGSIVLAVPLIVLPGSMGPYDDAKSVVLQALIGTTLLAWLVGRALGVAGRPAPRDRSTSWLLGAVLVYAAWLAFTTVTSVAPGHSLWGSFGRGYGLFTVSAAIAVFVLLQLQTRAAADVVWLIDMALLGSVPVCALAVAQALGWDPLPRPWDPATAALRVRSTLGQHIFLGSYLAVLVPLGLARLVTIGGERAPRTSSSGPWTTGCDVAIAVGWASGAVVIVALGRWIPAGALAAIPWGIAGAIYWRFTRRRMSTQAGWWRLGSLISLVAVQVVVVALSGARGPFLGLLVGLVVAACTGLILSRARRMLVAAAVGFALIGTFLALLGVRDSPIEALKGIPVLQRLASAMEFQPGSPGWVRLRVWKGITDAWGRQLAGREALPELAPRPRALTGYGLETQMLTLDRLARPTLGSPHARQERWTARYRIDRAHNEFLDHLVTLGLVGTSLWALILVMVVVRGVSCLRTEREPGLLWIRLGCLGAVTAHIAEGLVGIATPVPRVIFWIAVALLTRLPADASGRAAPTGARASGRTWGWKVAAAAAALLLAGVVIGSIRWLQASVAYASGTTAGIAGDLPTARDRFEEAAALAPTSVFASEAAADVALRLAAREPPGPVRSALLHDAERALGRVRDVGPARQEPWVLAGRLALLRARDGDRASLPRALAAYATAARLDEDPHVLAEWAAALAEGGDVAEARRIAERAVAMAPKTWLAWAILSRSAARQGDTALAERSAREARQWAPPDARRFIDALLQ